MSTIISNEVISNFLEGHDPEKYIVNIEAPSYENIVYIVINDPIKGKYIRKEKYTPFLWLHSDFDVNKLNFYNGDRSVADFNRRKYKIHIKQLRTKNDEGYEPERVKNGFKYLVTCDGSFDDLKRFFKDGGIKFTKRDGVGYEEHRKYFLTISTTEQFLIQTGKRLFKGFEEYNELHKLYFDLETSGLDPKTDKIFQIGIKDNKGFEKLIVVSGADENSVKISEINAIKEFFVILNSLKPTIIAGYNSAAFDWDFIIRRCKILGIKPESFVKAINGKEDKIRDYNGATLKLGNETERYTQHYIWGYNILDISHAVRRAQAINSDIKKWNLKYITKFSKAAKENRVYILGNKIYEIHSDRINKYAINELNGDWYKINDNNKLKEGYIEVSGSFIVERYLLDDLWETEQIDEIFNQSSFLLGKMIPTNYVRTCTSGTASVWSLLMLAWSYENELAIPGYQEKEDFPGGLSRLIKTGYSKNVVKFDYAALYPNAELTHSIFTDVDITGVMRGLLLYIADTRDKYKALKKKYEKEGNDKLAGFYDRKQLPIKILANSFFGSFGAPDIFPWGDIDCAGETTCRGRQYLRLMVRFFMMHKFEPLIMDTDGVHFRCPDSIDSCSYTSNGVHRFNEQNREYKGINALVAEFNDKYMKGRMGLDIDEICEATINFSRKNYAKLIDGEIKLTGNSVKSKGMPEYIEDFMDSGLSLLLNGKGYEFIEYYYEYLEKIYNYAIPLAKIANKSKVKTSMSEYLKKRKQKNKAGNPMPKQAHMELLISHNMKPVLGDVIYYVNVGTKKSHGDIKSITDKETGKCEVQFNCKLIPTSQIEENPDLKSEEYNVPRYVDAFNKKVKPLLVCFNTEIRDSILVTNPQNRKFFTRKETELINGVPYKEKDQDKLEGVLTMEEKEVKFWVRLNKKPNHIKNEKWEVLLEKFNTNKTQAAYT